MSLRENLELAHVEYKDNGLKVTLSFVDKTEGIVREVNFNKQNYDPDKKKFIFSQEKADWCEEKVKEHFGVGFDELETQVGTVKDVYCYDNFSSLYPVQQVKKFDKDMVGQIFETEVIGVEDDGVGVKIKFEYDGETYQSNMNYSTYVEAMKQWFVNEVKRGNQYRKFEEKFGIPIEQKDELVGKTIMVEVKSAFGTNTYAEVKPFQKKKK